MNENFNYLEQYQMDPRRDHPVFIFIVNFLLFSLISIGRTPRVLSPSPILLASNKIQFSAYRQLFPVLVAKWERLARLMYPKLKTLGPNEYVCSGLFLYEGHHSILAIHDV